MPGETTLVKLKAVEADCYWYIVKLKEFRNLKNPQEKDIKELEVAMEELSQSIESFRGR